MATSISMTASVEEGRDAPERGGVLLAWKR